MKSGCWWRAHDGSISRPRPTLLILRVSANQAAIGLQEARLLSEQKPAASALEQRVAEWTQRLEAANRELGKDILERKQAET